MRLPYDRITTTIEREWLAEIIAGTKKIEYRQIKPYWTNRFEKVSMPFELRLLNGMNPPVPLLGSDYVHALQLRRGPILVSLPGREEWRQLRAPVPEIVFEGYHFRVPPMPWAHIRKHAKVGQPLLRPDRATI